jgi:hypothetical protein
MPARIAPLAQANLSRLAMTGLFSRKLSSNVLSFLVDKSKLGSFAVMVFILFVDAGDKLFDVG